MRSHGQPRAVARLPLQCLAVARCGGATLAACDVALAHGERVCDDNVALEPPARLRLALPFRTLLVGLPRRERGRKLKSLSSA